MSSIFRQFVFARIRAIRASQIGIPGSIYFLMGRETIEDATSFIQKVITKDTTHEGGQMHVRNFGMGLFEEGGRM